MFRKINKSLLEWKKSKYRKPLILQGARQVGKTYSILEFGNKHYDNVAYFNFQTTPKLCNAFDEDITPKYLIPLLSRLSGKSISKEKTLIIFDEIQLCERALTSLKYFCEEANDYHIIAAGSLLGIAVNRKSFSFPVGKVDCLTMFPLDLEEFMMAFSENDLIKQIRHSFDTNQPITNYLHDTAMDLYRKYLVIGGMPEAVARFVETKDYNQVRYVQNSILMGYLDDMSKYQNAKSEIQKTRLTYNNLTVQLSRKNTRFLYKLIKTGARASEFENAIEWLTLANIVSRVYKIEQVKKPLENYRDIDSFKIYLSDVGLLCAKKEIIPDDVLYMTEELNDFKGGMAENFVNSQLIMNNYTTYYWESGNSAEIDFIIQKNGKLIPIEVKSADNTKAKSLKVYMQSFKPSYAIKISSKNFAFEDNVKNVPLYACFCI